MGPCTTPPHTGIYPVQADQLRDRVNVPGLSLANLPPFLMHSSTANDAISPEKGGA